ncbi:MATE family efflux transporter [uncultured Aliiroseovarius sp.]|uniref:MATE family efflux transporter n=1 Tax=uncultured Aliiroseovarius sp. TaxID=1658783 RepID=UPI00261A16AF|nr:MATE family efflux transporter [uncultured Aliiroseovarius sp.]
MLRVGLPISITTLAELGVYMGSTLFVAGFGPEATAAHALTLRLAGVAYALIAGLSQASTVRMARSLNEGGKGLQKETIRASGIIALGSGIFLPAILILAAFVSPTVLPAAGLSHEATEIAFWLLIVLAATEIIEPMGCAATGLLRGCSDTKVPMYYSLAGNWAVGVPAGLVLSWVFGFGVVGVWVGLLLGLSAAAVPTIVRVRRYI